MSDHIGSCCAHSCSNMLIKISDARKLFIQKSTGDRYRRQFVKGTVYCLKLCILDLRAGLKIKLGKTGHTFHIMQQECFTKMYRKKKKKTAERNASLGVKTKSFAKNYSYYLQTVTILKYDGNVKYPLLAHDHRLQQRMQICPMRKSHSIFLFITARPYALACQKAPVRSSCL